MNDVITDLFNKIGMSWSYLKIYMQLLISLSLVTHVYFFKHELDKDEPQIPYIQDKP